MQGDENKDIRTVLAEFGGKLDILNIKIDELKEKQEESNQALQKVKESIYGPDQGIYARIRDLEQWKATSTKVLYLLITGMVSLVTYFVKDFFGIQ